MPLLLPFYGHAMSVYFIAVDIIIAQSCRFHGPQGIYVMSADKHTSNFDNARI